LNVMWCGYQSTLILLIIKKSTEKISCDLVIDNGLYFSH